MKSISSALIKALREKGWLRTERFSLKGSFAGLFEIIKVRIFASPIVDGKENEKVDNFSLECKAPNGLASLSAYQVANMRIIKDDITAKPVDGKDAIYFADEIQDVVSNSVPFHSKFDDETGYEFKHPLNVVGAMVTKGEDGKPLIPLNRYKYYNAVLAHHQKTIGDPKAFLTRQDFKDYLASDVVIPGVPSTVSTMTLANGNKADDEGLWSFTLLVKDPAEVEA